MLRCFDRVGSRFDLDRRRPYDDFDHTRNRLHEAGTQSRAQPRPGGLRVQEATFLQQTGYPGQATALRARSRPGRVGRQCERPEWLGKSAVRLLIPAMPDSSNFEKSQIKQSFSGGLKSGNSNDRRGQENPSKIQADRRAFAV